MNKIEEYALNLVADGAEHVAEDDIDEDGEFDGDEDSWKAAGDLAVKLAHWIRENPETVLAAFKAAPIEGRERAIAARPCRACGYVGAQPHATNCPEPVEVPA